MMMADDLYEKEWGWGVVCRAEAQCSAYPPPSPPLTPMCVDLSSSLTLTPGGQSAAAAARPNTIKILKLRMEA